MVFTAIYALLCGVRQQRAPSSRLRDCPGRGKSRRGWRRAWETPKRQNSTGDARRRSSRSWAGGRCRCRCRCRRAAAAAALLVAAAQPAVAQMACAFEHTLLLTVRLQGVALYLFYAQPEDEAAMAAWLAPLAVVRGACLAGSWLYTLLSHNAITGPRVAHTATSKGQVPQGQPSLVWLETSLPSLLGTAVTFLALQSGLVLLPQLQHPDLGARMAHALQHAFAAGHRRAAIVGTDIPDLTAGIVLRALQALDSHQVRVHCPRPAVRKWLCKCSVQHLK